MRKYWVLSEKHYSRAVSNTDARQGKMKSVGNAGEVKILRSGGRKYGPVSKTHGRVGNIDASQLVTWAR